MIELRANPGPTGRLLREMLAAKGLLHANRIAGSEQVQGVVNYGHGGSSTLPTLNKRAGTINKLQELQLLGEKGVRTVPLTTRLSDYESTLRLMGRSIHHTRGTDIRVYEPRTLIGRHDFYTQIIPKRREFRVWAYRRTCIGVYEKVLTYPKKLGRRGRSREVWNWRNGYAYVYRQPADVSEGIKELGRQSVDALGLDFGAVDVISGVDGRDYVLEVNTAPGVEGPRQALTSLVNHIEKWVRGGFKKRNGEEDESRPSSVRNRG